MIIQHLQIPRFLSVDNAWHAALALRSLIYCWARSKAMRTAFLHPSYNPILLFSMIELFITCKRFVLRNNSTYLTAKCTSRTSNVPSPSSDARNAEYASWSPTYHSKKENSEFVYCSREGQQISFINLPYESLAWEWGKTQVRWVYKQGHRRHCREYLLLPQP